MLQSSIRAAGSPSGPSGWSIVCVPMQHAARPLSIHCSHRAVVLCRVLCSRCPSKCLVVVGGTFWVLCLAALTCSHRGSSPSINRRPEYRDHTRRSLFVAGQTIDFKCCCRVSRPTIVPWRRRRDAKCKNIDNFPCKRLEQLPALFSCVRILLLTS